MIEWSLRRGFPLGLETNGRKAGQSVSQFRRAWRVQSTGHQLELDKQAMHCVTALGKADSPFDATYVQSADAVQPAGVVRPKTG